MPKHWLNQLIFILIAGPIIVYHADADITQPWAKYLST